MLRLRGRTRADQARSMRRFGFGVMVVVGLFFALFVAGETVADPGGWLAAVLIPAWAAPSAAFIWLAWKRTDAAAPLLFILVAVVIALSVWAAIDPRGWGSFEDGHGPLRFVAAMAVALPTSVLGLRRPVAGGLLLLTLAFAPPLLTAIGGWRVAGGAPPAVPLAVLGSPWAITGGLYLIAARLVAPTPPSTACESEEADGRAAA